MFYMGHAQHEPEMSVTMSIFEPYKGNPESVYLYVHKRCVEAFKARTVGYALAQRTDGGSQS